jgi:hypothetical protein
MLWYQQCRILQVLVKIMYVDIIQCWWNSNNTACFLKRLETVHVYAVIILWVQTSILP